MHGIFRLRDLEVQEVSLVDRPANRRTFLIVKSDNGETEGNMSKANEEATEILRGLVALAMGAKGGPDLVRALARLGGGSLVPANRQEALMQALRRANALARSDDDDESDAEDTAKSRRRSAEKDWSDLPADLAGPDRVMRDIIAAGDDFGPDNRPARPERQKQGDVAWPRDMNESDSFTGYVADGDHESRLAAILEALAS